MTSELRQKLHRALPIPQDGQQELQNQTGINLETDVDRIVACARPEGGSNVPGAGMVLARGRFDEVKIEALMREHGAHVEDYSGKRVHVAARIAALADAGQILASASTVEDAGSGFALSKPNAVTLKGVSDSIDVVSVSWD